MRSAPELVRQELRKVHTRKKAVIFYDSQLNARRAVKLLFNALEVAEMEKDFEIALYNLAALQQQTFADAKALANGASVALFAVGQLPSEPILEWIDSWAEEPVLQTSLLVLLDSEAAADPNDHALLCSYFRAVAVRSLRHYNCENCLCRLPAAPLPPKAFPAETLRARTHASIVCMNLPVPQMAM
jgi:hypothetical protein